MKTRIVEITYTPAENHVVSGVKNHSVQHRGGRSRIGGMKVLGGSNGSYRVAGESAQLLICTEELDEPIQVNIPKLRNLLGVEKLSAQRRERFIACAPTHIEVTDQGDDCFILDDATLEDWVKKM